MAKTQAELLLNTPESWTSTYWWYDDGTHRPTGTKYPPNIGQYASNSEQTFEWITDQLLDANIWNDMMSWWGVGHPYLTNEAIQAYVTWLNAGAGGRNLGNHRKTIFYELDAGDGVNPTAAVIFNDMEYLRSNVFQSPWYKKVPWRRSTDGRLDSAAPVVTVYFRGGNAANFTSRYAAAQALYEAAHPNETIAFGPQIFSDWTTDPNLLKFSLRWQYSTVLSATPPNPYDNYGAIAAANGIGVWKTATVCPCFWRYDEINPRLARSVDAYRTAIMGTLIYSYNNDYHGIIDRLTGVMGTSFNEEGEGSGMYLSRDFMQSVMGPYTGFLNCWRPFFKNVVTGADPLWVPYINPDGTGVSKLIPNNTSLTTIYESQALVFDQNG